MKIYTKYIPFLIVALSTILSSCANDEDADVHINNNNIDFQTLIGSPTKVSTDLSFKSRFDDGDKIGIFAVRRASGESKSLAASDNYIHNQPLTYDAGSGKWKSDATLYYGKNGEVLDFYAYYPYDSQATDPTNIAFGVKVDQSTAQAHSHSGFMNAKAVNIAKGAPVLLQFAHRMAMVQVQVPKGELTGCGPNSSLQITLRSATTDATANLATSTLTSKTGEAQQLKMRRVETPDDAAQTYTYRALVPVQTLDKTKVSFKYEQDAELFFHPLPESCTLAENRAEAFSTTLPFTVHTMPIPAGRFTIKIPDHGDAHWEADAADFYPHEVNMSAFRIGKYEVTNAQFCRFLNEKKATFYHYTMAGYDRYYAKINGITVAQTCDSPDFTHRLKAGLVYKVIDGKGKWVPYEEISRGVVKSFANHPAAGISWWGANEFCRWRGGRLPTEAEWEHACRAGTSTAYSFGNDPALLDEYDLCNQLIGATPEAVGLRKPNPWGLYNMHGNVAEMCYSCLVADKLAGVFTNPMGIPSDKFDTNTQIIYKGGVHFFIYSYDRYTSAYRQNATEPAYIDEPSVPSGGFRICFPHTNQ